MNVLSLFDGMSCGRIALERCGFPITNYFASEIDKYAIQVAQANYPDTIHLGDVTKIKTHEGRINYFDDAPLVSDLRKARQTKIDLLIGGSPCQGFSWAGKRLNFEDPRSALFFEYVRLLRELKPRWFMLENVNMKQEHQDVISEHLGVKPVRINSNLVSAQNRDRLYWTNIPVRSMPENKRIYLKDILEDGWTDREKSHCIDANYFKGGNLKSYFEKNRRQLVFDFEQDPEGKSGLILAGEADLKGHGYNRRVYHPDGKAPTLAAASGGNLEPKILYPLARWRRRLKVAYSEEMRLMWRKLTPVECERLQTVPDGYTAHVSNTQRYRMLGNGWTVDVICHLLEGMKDG